MKNYSYVLLFALTLSAPSAYSMGTLPSKAKRLVKTVGSDMVTVTKETFHSEAIEAGATFGVFVGAPIGIIVGLEKASYGDDPLYEGAKGAVLGGAIGAASCGILGFYGALLLEPGEGTTKGKGYARILTALLPAFVCIAAKKGADFTEALLKEITNIIEERRIERNRILHETERQDLLRNPPAYEEPPTYQDFLARQNASRQNLKALI